MLGLNWTLEVGVPPGHLFLPAGVLGPSIWSSTSRTTDPLHVYGMELEDGTIRAIGKMADFGFAWAVRSLPPPTPQCSDGIDNDGDGQIDSDDRQCRSPEQTSEKHPNR